MVNLKMKMAPLKISKSSKLTWLYTVIEFQSIIPGTGFIPHLYEHLGSITQWFEVLYSKRKVLDSNHTVHSAGLRDQIL